MVRSQLPEVLQAGINLAFDDAGKTVAKKDEQIFGVKKITEATWKESSVTGFGLLRRKMESSPTKFDEIQRGYAHQATPESFALGFEISREMKEDNQVDLMNKMAKFLGLAAEESVQFSAALMLGRGFGAITAGSSYPSNTSTTDTSAATQTYIGADGVSLFSASHPIAGTPASTTAGYPMPSTYSNYQAAALNETNLAAMIQRMDLMPNERGLPGKKTAKLLVYPTALRLTANQILHSSSTTVTTSANPATSGIRNLIADENLVGMSWEHLIDPDDWFLVAADSKEHLLKIVRDLSSPIEYDYDTNKKVHIASIFRRWAFLWDDPRSICGSIVA